MDFVQAISNGEYHRSASLTLLLGNCGYADIFYLQCPFCTTPFLPPDLFGRINDVRRYLFWMLRTYGYPVAGFLLHKMDSWNGEREPISDLQEFLEYTKSYNANGAVALHVAMLSETLAKFKERKRGLGISSKSGVSRDIQLEDRS